MSDAHLQAARQLESAQQKYNEIYRLPETDAEISNTTVLRWYKDGTWYIAIKTQKGWRCNLWQAHNTVPWSSVVNAARGAERVEYSTGWEPLPRPTPEPPQIEVEVAFGGLYLVDKGSKATWQRVGDNWNLLTEEEAERIFD